MILVSRGAKALGVPSAVAAGLAGSLPVTGEVTVQGESYCVVPHDLASTLVLRNAGETVPAPVITQYAWPHARGWKPFEVQTKTVALMTTSRRCYVLNGMGTGKTICTLWAYDYLRSVGLVKKLLVVAPLSTLNFVWAKEVKQSMPHLSVSVLKGDKAKRLKALAIEADVYVINPEGMKILEAEIGARDDIDCMAIDELATFRNPTSDRTKACGRLIKRMAFAWGLTGSPCPKSPTDAYGQCKILTPGLNDLPKSFRLWEERVLVPGGPFRSQWKARKDAMDHVYAVMQPAVRFSLDDVIELPQSIELPIDVEMGPRQKVAYEQMREHCLALIDKHEIDAQNAGVAANKLLQISTGYLYGKDAEGKPVEVTLDNELRLDAMVEAVTNTPNPSIVFVPFKHALSGVAKRLADEGIGYERVDGSVSSKKRDEIFQRFQKGEIRCLVAHPACMAHGVTLTEADTIVWFGPLCNLEIFEQANARIRRIGQKRKQLYFFLQGTAMERRVYRMLQDRANFQSNLLGLFAAGSH